MNRLRNEKGVAMLIVMMVVVVLLGISGMFVLRTIQESRMAEIERNLAKSFYVAEGATQAGLNGLDNLINNFLFNTINNTNPSVISSYINNNVIAASDPDGIGFLIAYVKDGSTPVLTLNGTQAEYSVNNVGLGEGIYSYDIIIEEKTDPICLTAFPCDTWDFVYDYRIEATGASNNFSGKRLLLSGDFNVRVQRENFARYALFTNNQKTPGGSNVWFTGKTNFAGPLHTNGRYNIYGNPSGTFDGFVSQQDGLTRYYNNGWTILLDDDHNGTRDVPTFNAGFERDADAISLSAGSVQQDMIDQATGGGTYSSSGIYIPNNGTALTGGIFVKGSGDVIIQEDGSGNPQYKIVQGSTTKYVTLDKTNNQTTVEVAGGGTNTYSGLPDGIDDIGTIIYVDGTISNFYGEVDSNEEVTVASTNDIVINNDLEYESYTVAVGNPGDSSYVPPSADGEINKLGIVSWNGDVRIGTSAPDNVNVHGSIFASDGIFTVDSYNNQGIGPRGTATTLGGVITDNYGAFGLFSGSTGNQLSGYGRNFVYDERMQSGGAPPYFPTLNTFIAFTNDITDKMVWREDDT